VGTPGRPEVVPRGPLCRDLRRRFAPRHRVWRRRIVAARFDGTTEIADKCGIEGARTAWQYAASVESLMLTTEAMACETSAEPLESACDESRMSGPAILLISCVKTPNYLRLRIGRLRDFAGIDIPDLGSVFPNGANFPARATLRMAFLTHPWVSLYAASTLSCVCRKYPACMERRNLGRGKSSGGLRLPSCFRRIGGEEEGRLHAVLQAVRERSRGVRSRPA
jgi:hypothetical protein